MQHSVRTFLWLLGAFVLLGLTGSAVLFFADRYRHYSFTIDHQLPITQVRHQGQTRLCWDYSGTAFIEAELLRMGKPRLDLSEMFTAYHGYSQRAFAAIQNPAAVTFNPGGCIGDFMHCIDQFGILPESEMPAPPDSPNHMELSRQILQLSQQGSRDAILHSLDSAIGILPLSFRHSDSLFTPSSFRHHLGISARNYLQLTSFTSAPFYKFMVIECPDNWRRDSALNLPLDRLTEVVDSALANGFPVVWEADISSYNFSRHAQQGFITIPFTPHRRVSAFERQWAWNHHLTTDDHVMLLFGSARDQHGHPYYMIKNCWGSSGPYHGILFVSKAYFRYKTVNILLHRDAIPLHISKTIQIP